MSIEQYQAKMKSSIWKSLAQSGISLNMIPTEEQNKLVDHLTDNLLVMVNEILDEASAGVKSAVHAEPANDEEVVLWEGRPFLSLVEFYTLTNERIKLSRGMIGKDIESFELIRVQDIDISQSIGERMLGLGDIRISGADPSNPTITLRNIHQPNEVYEIIRKAWLAARKKYGLIFREDM